MSVLGHKLRLSRIIDPATKSPVASFWTGIAGAADYAKRVSVRANRHVNPSSAVHDLLGSWGRDEVLSRRDKALARRLSSQRLIDLAGKTAESLSPEEDRDEASLPAVIDLVSRMPKATGLGEVIDDLDVFDRYYDEHPDEDAFEVFHE